MCQNEHHRGNSLQEIITQIEMPSGTECSHSIHPSHSVAYVTHWNSLFGYCIARNQRSVIASPTTASTKRQAVYRDVNCTIELEALRCTLDQAITMIAWVEIGRA